MEYSESATLDPSIRFCKLSELRFRSVNFGKIEVDVGRKVKAQLDWLFDMLGEPESRECPGLSLVDELVILVDQHRVPLKKITFEKCRNFSQELYQKLEDKIGRATDAGVCISWAQ